MPSLWVFRYCLFPWISVLNASLNSCIIQLPRKRPFRALPWPQILLKAHAWLLGPSIKWHLTLDLFNENCFYSQDCVAVGSGTQHLSFASVENGAAQKSMIERSVGKALFRLYYNRAGFCQLQKGLSIPKMVAILPLSVPRVELYEHAVFCTCCKSIESF